MVVLAFIPTLYYIITTKNLVLVHAMTDSLMWGLLVLWVSRYVKSVVMLAEILLMVSALLLLPRLFGYDAGGLLGNASMSGCFVVALATLVNPAIGITYAFIALLAKSSMTAMCVLGYVFLHIPKRAAILLSLSIIFAMLAIDPEFVSTNGRYENWVRTIGIIKQFDLQLMFTGLGFGSYSVLNPTVQGGATNLFIWAHNDYLQLMYEGGIWAILVFGYYAYRMFRVYPGYVIITGLAALGNMPFHFLLWLFVSGVVLHGSLDTSKRVY